MDQISLPALPADFEPTRATLHAYALGVGAVTRAHGITHPKWWHLGLKVRPEGLATDPIPLPSGGTVAVRMDLVRHVLVVRSNTGFERTFDMRAGATGSEMGDRLTGAATELGLADRYQRRRFENHEPRPYSAAAAEAFFAAFVEVHTIFERRRVTLGDRVSPIQVWPHGFDLAFEWFGTRTIEHDGERVPAQVNLGFYPGERPYFYSNPWPFEEHLLDGPLPHGGVWHTGEWSGAMLPYDAAQRSPNPGAVIGDFAAAVFEAAAPTL